MTRSQARRLQQVRRWHRRSALVVALWLAILAVTGSAINHAHDWGLDRAALPRALQGALYGITPDGTHPCAGLEPAPDACQQAFARLPAGAGSVLLAPHAVLLLGPDGQAIESLPAGQLGLARIEAGLASDQWLYLRGAEQVVATDFELLEWREPAASERAALQGRDWRQANAAAGPITWERLLLDLHAARFLGPAARWFTDLMAALIVLLVIGGLWLYRLRGRGGER